jgi:hypothetical protein
MRLIPNLLGCQSWAHAGSCGPPFWFISCGSSSSVGLTWLSPPRGLQERQVRVVDRRVHMCIRVCFAPEPPKGARVKATALCVTFSRAPEGGEDEGYYYTPMTYHCYQVGPQGS